MIVDLERDGAEQLAIPYDVCISGSGPAGMSMALKLAEKHHRVLLLEAGGLTLSEVSSDVYRGLNTGFDYFPSDISRQRFFGGTSNHWGGWCHVLEAADFEPRDYVSHSGWPIRKTDLDPYISAAAAILDIKTPSVPDYLQLNGSDPNLQKINFSFSLPITRFASKYRKAIESSKNIVCLLNANVTDIKLNENGNAVSSLAIANYGGQTFEAMATHFVLCHGGIENPRTLLNANHQIAQGVGNSKDLVGRFFMEHPTFTVASVLLNHEHPAFTKFANVKNQLGTAFYQPTAAFRSREEVLNFGLRIDSHNVSSTPPDDVSFKDRLKRMLCETDSLLALADDLKGEGRVLCPHDFRIKTASEQNPNPDSRIKLGGDVDRFGNRRVDVDWQLTPMDKHTLRQSALQAGRVMAEKNLGRVRLLDWLVDSSLSFPDTAHDEVGGFHHMGTTRMASSPEHGVVDSNLQVFGIRNLYMGGSSVFPTAGHVNPTFTIVQLSLRLADHLHRTLNSG